MVVTNRLPTVLLHSMWTPSRAVSITASLELRLGKSELYRKFSCLSNLIFFYGIDLFVLKRNFLSR